jgi:fumarylacetoacetase
MGEPITLENARDYLFGVVLLNDWSARDIQTWEMVPLGPFNAKNFGTTLSPWVVTWDALEPFLVPPLEPDRPLLPYLKARNGEDHVFTGSLTVSIKPSGGRVSNVVTRTDSKNLIFSFPQMLAHHSINGCPFRAGDLLGSGTISGPDPGTFGSLLEQTSGGKNHITISGEQRTFLQDGDEVVFTGVCRGIITKTRSRERGA